MKQYFRSKSKNQNFSSTELLEANINEPSDLLEVLYQKRIEVCFKITSILSYFFLKIVLMNQIIFVFFNLDKEYQSKCLENTLL